MAYTPHEGSRKLGPKGDLVQPQIGALLNQTHPLARGLRGCWLFNEGGGTRIYDYSGYNNHGTVQLNPNPAQWHWSEGTSVTIITPPFEGRAFYNEGNGKVAETYIQTTCDLSVATGGGDPVGLTVAAWLCPFNAGSASDDRGLVFWQGNSAANGGGTEDEFHFGFGDCTTANDRVLQGFFGSSSDIFTVFNLDIGNSEKEWKHYACTVRDIGQTTPVIAVYIDGIEVATDTGVVVHNFANWDTNLRIGAPGVDTARIYDGMIAGAMVWDQALATDEVLELATDTYGMFRWNTTKYFLPPAGGGVDTTSKRMSVINMGVPWYVCGPSDGWSGPQLIDSINVTDTSDQITITHGFAIQENDFLLAFLHRNGAGTDMSSIDGFSDQFEEDHPTETSRLLVSYKIAGASEGATFQWTWTALGSQQCVAILAQFRSVNTSTPFDVIPSATYRNSSAGPTTTSTAPTITTTANNCIGITCHGADAASMTYSSPTNGYSFLENSIPPNRPGCMCYKSLPTSGAVGAQSVTQENQDYWAVHFAIKS